MELIINESISTHYTGSSNYSYVSGIEWTVIGSDAEDWTLVEVTSTTNQVVDIKNENYGLVEDVNSEFYGKFYGEFHLLSNTTGTYTLTVKSEVEETTLHNTFVIYPPQVEQNNYFMIIILGILIMFLIAAVIFFIITKNIRTNKPKMA